MHSSNKLCIDDRSVRFAPKLPVHNRSFRELNSGQLIVADFRFVERDQTLFETSAYR